MSKLKAIYNGSNNNGEWNPIYPDGIVKQFDLEVPDGSQTYAIFTGKDDWSQVITAINSRYPTATTEVLE